jgi:phosphoribosylaminoimidazolecarboxamide formyltransferase/IMP cyclohydrolase
LHGWFGQHEGDFPGYLNWDFRKVQDLRYGENPHQRAAFYTDIVNGKDTFGEYLQLHGAQLSFNNLLDFDAARRCCDEFVLPSCVIIKHNNPCGVAVSDTITGAYDKALSCDPVSAFGSVIAVNRTVD